MLKKGLITKADLENFALKITVLTGGMLVATIGILATTMKLLQA